MGETKEQQNVQEKQLRRKREVKHYTTSCTKQEKRTAQCVGDPLISFFRGSLRKKSQSGDADKDIT